MDDLRAPESKAPRRQNPALLFDLDGTLIDTAYEHALAWSSAFRTTGMAVPTWKIHRHIGMSGKSLVRQLVRDRGSRARKIDLEQLEKKHDAEFTKMLGRIQSLPGASKLLRRLTQMKVPWAIATTGNRKQTKRLLRILSLPSEIEVVTGDDVEKAKPSPDVFITAASRLKVPIEHCIVVGDSVWDMLAAGRRRALASASYQVAIARRSSSNRARSAFTPIRLICWTTSKTLVLAEAAKSLAGGRRRFVIVKVRIVFLSSMWK
ncbi:MAG: HAD family phosphatase [Candidatus Sulfotelmatobacter sp.]